MSTVGQDLEAQRRALVQLGVAPERVHVDHGFSGSDRERPGLREALAACSPGDELVVAKLDRLARSVPDARDILDDLTASEVRLNISGSVHDPTDPVGRLLFTVLSTIAEFETDLIRTRTREGMAVARAKGRLKGKKPKLSTTRESELVALYEAGEHTSAELGEKFSTTRSTLYRALARAGVPPRTSAESRRSAAVALAKPERARG